MSALLIFPNSFKVTCRRCAVMGFMWKFGHDDFDFAPFR